MRPFLITLHFSLTTALLLHSTPSPLPFLLSFLGTLPILCTVDFIDGLHNTRVLALLGVSDPDSPSGGGRFAADFYLFNRPLAGLGRGRTWLTSLDLGSAV